MGPAKRAAVAAGAGAQMQFDDRLATVLRMRTSSAAGERTQFRQLLDLLGTASPKRAAEPAFARLDALRERIPTDEQARILREAGLRLRNPVLVEYLASGDAKSAASVMATAKLSERDWEALIPRLPIIARGFLRHRRDLPPGALRQLTLLGVGDLVLSDERAPLPSPHPAEPVFTDTKLPEQSSVAQVIRRTEQRPAPAARPLDPATAPIGDLIERIEQFRSARRIPVLAPRLPLGDAAPAETSRIDSFDLATDAQGRAIWASPSVAPWIVGMALTPGPLVRMDHRAAAALNQRQPLHAQLLHLSGALAIAGDWRIDAAPVFAPETGGFTGYRCRLLRAIPPEMAAPAPDTQAEKMRQVLHELRTPVNAIQGFAEIIQQQLFAPVPHEYRAHAASIAVDAAKLLAGFAEIDRLAQLESGATALDPGEADLRVAVEETLHRLGSVLNARKAGFDLAVSGAPFIIAISPSEALTLCWRLLASAAGALGPSEQCALRLASDGERITLELSLPAGLREPATTARSRSKSRGAVSAGMFGRNSPFGWPAPRRKRQAGHCPLQTTVYC